jgi:tetratricopeptide (TPR) repeat protein
LSPQSPPSDETRIASNLDDAADPAATRIAQDIDRPQHVPPDFDPEATRIGSKDLLVAVLPPGAAAPVERWKIGEKIGGRYEVLAIHKGAMGVVYGTFDHKLHRPRALKTIQDRHASNEKLRHAFAIEAAVWVRLEQHPFIARAYTVTRFDDLPYVVSEYVRGKEGRGPDLRSWIGDPSLSLAIAVELALQIAQGMQHAVHKVQGLVHQDLKPANILVNELGQAMVTDFGLAWAGLAGGTPAYMAPEQWRSERCDTRTDIYAYGCILYELFTAHRLYAATTEEEWRRGHLGLQAYPPRSHRPELPEDLAAFVVRCLDKDPDRRPAGWSEVVPPFASWFHQLTGQPAVVDFSAYELDAGELLNAGHSLAQLGGHDEEQLAFYERGLAAEDVDDATVAILLVNKGIALNNLGRREEAAGAYDEVIARFSGATASGIRRQLATALLNKGAILGKLGSGDEAIGIYDDLVARFGRATDASMLELVAKALLYKGMGLRSLNYHTDAIPPFEEVARRFRTSPEDGIQRVVKLALEQEIATLRDLGITEKGLHVINKMLDEFGQAKHSVIQERAADALIAKGLELAERGSAARAVILFDQIAARLGAVSEEPLLELAAKALANKALALGEMGNDRQQIRACDELVTRFGNQEGAAIRERVARILRAKAVALGRLGRAEEKLAVCDDVVVRFGNAAEVTLREHAALAVVAKAMTLAELGKNEAAIRAYDAVVERFGHAKQTSIRELVLRALVNKVSILQGQNRHEESIQVYGEIAERFADAGKSTMCEQAATALVEKGLVLAKLGRRQEAIAALDEMVRKFESAPEGDIREQVARALVSKADVLAELGEPEEERRAWDDLLERFGRDLQAGIRKMVSTATEKRDARIREQPQRTGTASRTDRTRAGREAFLRKKIAIMRTDGRTDSLVDAIDELIDLLSGDSGADRQEELATLRRERGDLFLGREAQLRKKIDRNRATGWLEGVVNAINELEEIIAKDPGREAEVRELIQEREETEREIRQKGSAWKVNRETPPAPAKPEVSGGTREDFVRRKIVSMRADGRIAGLVEAIDELMELLSAGTAAGRQAEIEMLMREKEQALRTLQANDEKAPAASIAEQGGGDPEKLLRKRISDMRAQWRLGSVVAAIDDMIALIMRSRNAADRQMEIEVWRWERREALLAMQKENASAGSASQAGWTPSAPMPDRFASADSTSQAHQTPSAPTPNGYAASAPAVTFGHSPTPILASSSGPRSRSKRIHYGRRISKWDKERVSLFVTRAALILAGAVLIALVWFGVL